MTIGSDIGACEIAPAASSETQLEILLSETPEDARRRVLAQKVREGVPIVLYGAGNLGQSTARRLGAAGIPAAAFADDTPGKQGLEIEGLPVLSPDTAVGRFGPATTFVVTIHNPTASFLKIRNQLRMRCPNEVVSFLSLAWSYPEHFLPYLQFERPESLLRKRVDVRCAFRLLADEESRRQFVAHLRFRLLLDFSALPSAALGDYFPADVLAPLPDDTTFVDCGAFDGDTIRMFLAHQKGKFGKILAFEPDPRNYRRLIDYIGGLDQSARGRIAASHAGVGERRESLSFDSTGNTGAAFKPHGSTKVDTVALHEAIPDDGRPLFIKIDVEGDEAAALRGAAALIRKRHPILAISVYHRPGDLWELPARLHELDPAAKLFLRTLGEDGMDVVCFAAPADRCAQHHLN